MLSPYEKWKTISVMLFGFAFVPLSGLLIFLRYWETDRYYDLRFSFPSILMLFAVLVGGFSIAALASSAGEKDQGQAMGIAMLMCSTLGFFFALFFFLEPIIFGQLFT